MRPKGTLEWEVIHAIPVSLNLIMLNTKVIGETPQTSPTSTTSPPRPKHPQTISRKHNLPLLHAPPSPLQSLIHFLLRIIRASAETLEVLALCLLRALPDAGNWERSPVRLALGVCALGWGCVEVWGEVRVDGDGRGGGTLQMWERVDKRYLRISHCASARRWQAGCFMSGDGFVGWTAPDVPPLS